MKNAIAFLFLFVSFLGFSQKIKLKDGVILVDKVEYIKLREDKVSRRCYIISNLKGEDILYIKGMDYYDPAEVKPTTPGYYSDGKVFYFEVLSADLNTIYFENRPSGSPFNSLYTENTISNLFNGEAINSDGTLNLEKLEILSKKIGFEFSKKRDAINNQRSNNTIIIKEEPRRSGVNINIGR
jgi:hypothetical protein